MWEMSRGERWLGWARRILVQWLGFVALDPWFTRQQARAMRAYLWNRYMVGIERSRERYLSGLSRMHPGALEPLEADLAQDRERLKLLTEAGVMNLNGLDYKTWEALEALEARHQVVRRPTTQELKKATGGP
jgi:hypothetical protein